MFKISRDQVHETEPFKFVCEASDVGLPVLVSQWPENIETDIGNGLSLFRDFVLWNKESIDGVRYRQNAGCIQLTIYND
jgi:hypothetical protein